MKFNFSEISDCCFELETALENTRKTYEECTNQLNQMKNSNIWIGKAADGFEERLKKTMAVCESNEKYLQSLINYIKSCSTRYEDTEKSVMSELADYVKRGEI